MPETRIRIATFNLENLGQELADGPSREARVRALRPMLRRLRADVLCLQEVNAERTAKGRPRETAALKALLEGTAHADWPLRVTASAKGPGPMDVHNLVIISRFPILSGRQVRHELVAAPDYRLVAGEYAGPHDSPLQWDRPILCVRLDLGRGRTLDVINLHLRSPLAVPLSGQKLGPFAWRSTAAWAEGFFMAGVKRAGQALETRLLLEEIFEAESEPLIVVAGDFNAELHEVPVRIIMGGEEDTGNGDLADRALIAVERALPPTQRFTVSHRGRPQMLDHILSSRALMGCFRQVEIHNEALGDELAGYHGIERSPESFHAPVVAEFVLED